MPKSRRFRKIERLQQEMDRVIASMRVTEPWPEPFRSHADAWFRAIWTAEAALDMERCCIEMECIHQQACRLSAAIDRRFGPGRPGTPGSHRTKRLRKKRSLAYAWG
jgi:hypothetical protein